MNPAAQLKSIKEQFRRDGFHPAPRYGKGVWVNDCRVRSIRLDHSLGWIWIPSISRSLLIRSVQKAVAARS